MQSYMLTTTYMCPPYTENSAGFFSSFLLCYKTIVMNAHIVYVYVYVPCGPLIGESINL